MTDDRVDEIHEARGGTGCIHCGRSRRRFDKMAFDMGHAKDCPVLAAQNYSIGMAMWPKQIETPPPEEAVRVGIQFPEPIHTGRWLRIRRNPEREWLKGRNALWWDWRRFKRLQLHFGRIEIVFDPIAKDRWND